MRKIVILVASTLMLVSGIVRADPLSISTGEYPPYTDSSTPGGGIINTIVTELADAAGFTANFAYMPWKRGLELARTGRYAAASFWYYSADREADFIHVGPLLEDRLVFYYIDGQAIPEWETLSDLAGYRIGAVPDYTLTPEFWSLSEAGVLDVHLAPSDTANLRKLLAGRIDLFAISEIAGWNLIKQVFTAQEQARFRTLETPLSTSDAYLLVSRADPNATAIAEALMTALRERSAQKRAALATP